MKYYQFIFIFLGLCQLALGDIAKTVCETNLKAGQKTVERAARREWRRLKRRFGSLKASKNSRLGKQLELSYELYAGVAEQNFSRIAKVLEVWLPWLLKTVEK